MAPTANKKHAWHFLLFFLILIGSSCDPPEAETSAASREAEKASALEIEWPKDNGQWLLKTPYAHKSTHYWILTDLESHFQPQNTEDSPLSIKTPKALLTIDNTHLSGSVIHLEHTAWRLTGESFSTVQPLEHWEIKSVHAHFYLHKK